MLLPLKVKNLLLILTYRCNSKCRHCDIWRSSKNSKDELSFDIVKKIIKDPLIKNITHIELSGGEPFMRNDFRDILKTIESEFALNIGISTNGLLINKIISDLNAIKNKDRLTIRLSLDGLEKTHDWQRGVQGAFKNVLITAEKVRIAYPPVKIEFLFTITKENYKQIIPVYRFIKNIDKKYWFTVGVNQFVKNYKTKIRDYKKEQYEFKPKEVKDITLQLKFLFNKYLQEKNYHEALFITQIIRYLKNKPSELYCSSPSESLIITPDGKIYNCINEESIGKITASGLEKSIDCKKMKLHALKGLKKECSQCVLRMGRFPSLYRFLPSFENYILKKKRV